MSRIDNTISIIMVFVTAFSFATASSLNALMTLLVLIVGFMLYEIVVNVANSNPSIRTVLHVTVGFVFGLSLTMILNIDKGWLSAIICILCMGYKYTCANATAKRKSYSKNIFVIVVNAFFYAIMFTIVECILFANTTLLFLMLYLISFAFVMCLYIIYKSAEKVPVSNAKSSAYVKRNVGSDWRHIMKRSGNYYKEVRHNIGSSLDRASDGINRVRSYITNIVMPSNDAKYSHDEYKEIRDKLNLYKQQIDALIDDEDLNDNETDMLYDVKDEYDAVYDDFYREQRYSYLECEARISEIANHMEMLKNSIRVRKARDKEDAEREAQRSQRSKAQQERRRREREAKKAKEEQEKAEREEEERKDREQKKEDEKKRYDEEKRRQEKRRRERNSKSSGKSSGYNNGSEKSDNKADDLKKAFTTGDDTKYFKGCNSLDELSLRYKKLCLIYHPDSSNGDADTYIELKEEYERLKKRLSI